MFRILSSQQNRGLLQTRMNLRITKKLKRNNKFKTFKLQIINTQLTFLSL